MITTALELDFADGAYLFDLKLPQMAELQEKRGAIFALYGRVLKGRFLIDGVPIADTSAGQSFAEDLFETIRLALIGGGRGIVDEKEIEVSPIMAKRLVENYCHAAPLKESWAIAAAVLGARIEGYSSPKAEPAQEPAAEEARPPRKKSTSSRSSAPA